MSYPSVLGSPETVCIYIYVYVNLYTVFKNVLFKKYYYTYMYVWIMYRHPPMGTTFIYHDIIRHTGGVGLGSGMGWFYGLRVERSRAYIPTYDLHTDYRYLS